MEAAESVGDVGLGVQDFHHEGQFADPDFDGLGELVNQPL